MNKKLANVFAVLFDLLCLEVLWFGYYEFQHILMAIAKQADMIKFGNRVGFYIIGVGFPLIHLLGIIDHFWPGNAKRYNLINRGLATIALTLLLAGIVGSSWIKARVENAGYIYCGKASGVSELARTLVYTRDMQICERMEAIR